jgi:hypothetical protein
MGMSMFTHHDCQQRGSSAAFRTVASGREARIPLSRLDTWLLAWVVAFWLLSVPMLAARLAGVTLEMDLVVGLAAQSLVMAIVQRALRQPPDDRHA